VILHDTISQAKLTGAVLKRKRLDVSSGNNPTALDCCCSIYVYGGEHFLQALAGDTSHRTTLGAGQQIKFTKGIIQTTSLLGCVLKWYHHILTLQEITKSKTLPRDYPNQV
jgi:hypothetical protein